MFYLIATTSLSAFIFVSIILCMCCMSTFSNCKQIVGRLFSVALFLFLFSFPSSCSFFPFPSVPLQGTLSYSPSPLPFYIFSVPFYPFPFYLLCLNGVVYKGSCCVSARSGLGSGNESRIKWVNIFQCKPLQCKGTVTVEFRCKVSKQ